MVTVSIIMPAYNVSEFVFRSINSVLNQTFQDWELLIVDDCSTDDTVGVIQSFVDKRIKLIVNTNNLGGAGSRNVAIAKACGRYLAFLDSDDVWTPEKLEKQIAFMQRQKIGFSFSGYSTITEQDEILDKIEVPERVRFYQMALCRR